MVTLPPGGSDAEAAGEGELAHALTVSQAQNNSTLTGPERPTLSEGE